MMKKILSLSAVLLAFFCQSAFGCDEQCLKEKAETKYNVSLPDYLTWKHCDGIKSEFMTESLTSLEAYKDRFSTKYKGPLKNTRDFLQQRRKWLKQCDNYLRATNKGRIFKDKATTKKIFAKIDILNKELDAFIGGASYATEDESKASMDQKIGDLIKVVSDHRDLMHIRGRYVVR